MSHRTCRTLAVAALTATTLVGSLVGGLAAPALAADDGGPSAPSTTCAELWAGLPQRLQDDLEDARALPPRAQRVAMRAINRAALRGLYGDDVEQLAEAREERRQELWAMAPEQLRADVRAAWSLPFREQRRALRAIRTAALSGVYGEDVQQVAQARRDWLQTCPRSGNAI